MDDVAADRYRSPNESRLVELPVESPDSPLPMSPATAVSAEIASLLPPVGILQEDVFASQPAALPLALPRPLPLKKPVPTVGEPRPVHRSAAGSSVSLTIVMIATAMGVGAVAMIPALDRVRNPSSPVVTSTKKIRPSETIANSAKADRVTSRPTPMSASSSRPGRPSTAMDDPLTPTADEGMLDSGFADITSLLRNRDVAGATARMRRLADGNWSETQAARIAQHAALISAVHSFWEAFDDALDTAAAGRSVHWAGQEGVLVEVSAASLIVRRAGQNVQIDRSELRQEVVRALAESLLDLGVPRNQVCLGAYLYVTSGRGSSEVRRLWQSASEAGESVSLLIPLLAEP